MKDIVHHRTQLLHQGFTTIGQIYSNGEIEQMLAAIAQVDHTDPTVRKSADLFAIRQFLKQVPEAERSTLKHAPI